MMTVTTMQAANYDNWHPFILLAGIFAFFTAGVFILGTWKVLNMIDFYGNLGCLDAQ